MPQVLGHPAMYPSCVEHWEFYYEKENLCLYFGFLS